MIPIVQEGKFRLREGSAVSKITQPERNYQGEITVETTLKFQCLNTGVCVLLIKSVWQMVFHWVIQGLRFLQSCGIVLRLQDLEAQGASAGFLHLVPRQTARSRVLHRRFLRARPGCGMCDFCPHSLVKTHHKGVSNSEGSWEILFGYLPVSTKMIGPGFKSGASYLLELTTVWNKLVPDQKNKNKKHYKL